MYTIGGEYKGMWLSSPPVCISHSNLEGPITLERLGRFGSVIPSMLAQPMPTYSRRFLDRPRCLRRTSAGGICKRLYTPPVYISLNTLEGAITLERLDRFGSTIVSMITPAHADIPQLFSDSPDVCASNERRWCIYALVYTTGGAYNKYTTGGVYSITDLI